MNITDNESLFFDKGDDGEIDYCRPFNLVSNFDPDHTGNCQASDFNTSDPYDLKVENCDKFIYAGFEFESTFVTENNLLCDKQFQVGFNFDQLCASLTILDFRWLWLVVYTWLASFSALLSSVGYATESDVNLRWSLPFYLGPEATWPEPFFPTMLPTPSQDSSLPSVSKIHQF